MQLHTPIVRSFRWMTVFSVASLKRTDGGRFGLNNKNLLGYVLVQKKELLEQI